MVLNRLVTVTVKLLSRLTEFPSVSKPARPKDLRIQAGQPQDFRWGAKHLEDPHRLQGLGNDFQAVGEARAPPLEIYLPQIQVFPRISATLF